MNSVGFMKSFVANNCLIFQLSKISLCYRIIGCPLTIEWVYKPFEVLKIYILRSN